MIWLVDIDIGGRTYRYATQACEVTDASGNTYAYAEGLADPAVSYAAAYGSGEVSIGLRIDDDVDWAGVVTDGTPLARRPGVLRRWTPGTLLERARVVLRGLTSRPRWGAAGEGLNLSLTRSPAVQTRTVPDTQAVVSETTWPEAAEGALGRTYPVVIGAPGHTEDADPYPVVPVPQVKYSTSVLGDYGVIWLGGHATRARLAVADAETGEWVYEERYLDVLLQDGLGRPVAGTVQGYPALSGGTLPPSDPAYVGEIGSPDDEYYAGFRDDDYWGGGLRSRHGGLLRGAGDVIDWVLSEFYTGPVDFGRVSDVRSRLNRYKIDTWIDAPVNIWEWLRREVLPLLSVELREGVAGLYPAILRYDLTEADCRSHLDADPETGWVTRSSEVEETDDDIINEVTIRFRPGRGGSSEWLEQRIIGADASIRRYAAGAPSGGFKLQADGDVIGLPICAQSQATWGVLATEIEAHAVWDPATAVQIACDMATRRALPRMRVRYMGDVEHLEVGEGVLLTDPDLHLDHVVALVTDVVPGAAEGAAEVEVLILG